MRILFLTFDSLICGSMYLPGKPQKRLKRLSDFWCTRKKVAEQAVKLLVKYDAIPVIISQIRSYRIWEKDSLKPTNENKLVMHDTYQNQMKNFKLYLLPATNLSIEWDYWTDIKETREEIQWPHPHILEKVAKKHQAVLRQSFMVGYSPMEKTMAARAGVKYWDYKNFVKLKI